MTSIHIDSLSSKTDTIIAIATPPGRGGVGILRLSGPTVEQIATQLIGVIPTPRMATYKRFYDRQKQLIDTGLVLYFPAPNSFTGEAVLELQIHGSPIALNLLLHRAIELGARLARPGEFSERAFLNGKLDLTQAEAIADLIASRTEQAAHAATNSLQGMFSKKINNLSEKIIYLRMYVEAALDFAEEEIDFLNEAAIHEKLRELANEFVALKQQTRQGQLLRDGFNLAIIGQPNVGKSSLINELTGQDTAIVSAIPGTTRDILRADIQVEGMPVHLCDTAGLRHSEDEIEQEGMRRAYQEIERADLLIVVCDARTGIGEFEASLLAELTRPIPVLIVQNKVDLIEQSPRCETDGERVVIWLSAKTGNGMDLLYTQIKQVLHYEPHEGAFIARQRHLNALNQAEIHLLAAIENGQVNCPELLAEELRLSHDALGEITGKLTSDELLGRIFSTFCIGK